MKKRTPEEIMKAIQTMGDEDEMDRILAMDDDALDRELREAGFDPETVRASGAALAKELLERRERLAWQAGAQDALDRVRARFDRQPARTERLPRAELLARIARARTDPRLAQPVAVMFRNRSADEASDEELEAILDEIEALAEHEGE
jgi:hypothetical protein